MQEIVADVSKSGNLQNSSFHVPSEALRKGEIVYQTGTTSSQIISNLPSDALFEVKNGKVASHQKPVSYEKLSETMQETVNFRQFIQTRVSSNEGPLDSIPPEHTPLIAKLVHESDKPTASLAKHIRQELLPSGTDLPTSEALNNSLPLATLEASIKRFATRVNYGLDAYESLRPPAAACVWRWEVNVDLYDVFPAGVRKGLTIRREEREKAKAQLKTFFETLPLNDKLALYKGGKPIEKEEAVNVDENGEQVENAKKVGRPKKAQDPEKMAKEREKQERKAAKAEKEKKALEAQSKSRSLMANFFGLPVLKSEGKPETTSSLSLPSTIEAKRTATPKYGRSPPNERTTNTSSRSGQSDFEKVFKPFVLKKDAEMAPVNSFRTDRAIIILDHDNESLDGAATQQTHSVKYNEWTAQHLLKASLKTLHPTRSIPPWHPCAMNSLTSLPVRALLTQLSEAEVVGDTHTVAGHLATLSSRAALPAKVFIFHTDLRPGYFGTFTKTSRVITARRPFQRDALAFDYGYDSGEDWEEEEGGDDVMELDDIGSGDDGSNVGSDLDDWLIDDEEVDEAGMEMPEELVVTAQTDDILPPPAFPLTKRKAAGEGKGRAEKKRRLVVPLVPFIKGPCWETKLGNCEHAMLESFRVKLLSDTPYPVDPFTFVSAPLFSEQNSTAVVHSHTSVTTSSNSFHVARTVNALDSRATSGGLLPQPQKQRKSVPTPTPVPKTQFPDEHLPLLFSKVAVLNASSIVLIVESVYQELKTQKVRKKVVEAKVREVVEKDRFKKVWVVKSEFLAGTVDEPEAGRAVDDIVAC